MWECELVDHNAGDTQLTSSQSFSGTSDRFLDPDLSLNGARLTLPTEAKIRPSKLIPLLNGPAYRNQRSHSTGNRSQQALNTSNRLPNSPIYLLLIFRNPNQSVGQLYGEPIFNYCIRIFFLFAEILYSERNSQFLPDHLTHAPLKDELKYRSSCRSGVLPCCWSSSER